MKPVVVFTDRDGDQLSVRARNIEGNLHADPIISIIHDPNSVLNARSQSVVLREEEVGALVVNLVEGLNLDTNKIHALIADLLDILGEKLQGE